MCFCVGSWSVGDLCDCRDSVRKWLEAKILKINIKENLVFVSYVGWPARWDGKNHVASQHQQPHHMHMLVYFFVLFVVVCRRMDQRQ